MASLVESVKYGAINTNDTTTTGLYVFMLSSEAYTLQDNTTIDGKFIITEEMVVISQYLCSMQIDTNWYWNQRPQKHVIKFPKITIIHPRLEVNAVTYFHKITKHLCNRTQAKKSNTKTAYMFD